MTTKDIFSSALALPRNERAHLAHELLVSLDDRRDEDAAEAWLREIERRLEEVESGTAVLEEWDAVRSRIAARLSSR